MSSVQVVHKPNSAISVINTPVKESTKITLYEQICRNSRLQRKRK